VADFWSPERYDQFQAQRHQPFHDLLGLVAPSPGCRVLDLGCGTGELTRKLHDHVQAAATLGIDNSPNMLRKAQQFAGATIQFQLADIATFDLSPGYDLIFSNAALQWLPDHPGLLARLTSGLAAGGQIAIQLPAMECHASHVVARQLAQRPAYRDLLGGFVHHLEALAPERYAELLFELGYKRQHVRLQIYGHLLAEPDAVVDWMRGTLLTCYQSRLAPEQFERFVADYRREVVQQLAASKPFFFAFRRILIWGRRS
jgi:trans-aconitate 2-methyltransferase